MLKKLSVSFQRTLVLELDPDLTPTNTPGLENLPNPPSACGRPPTQQWTLRHPQPHPHPKLFSWLTYLPSSRHTSAVSTILAESEGLLKPDMIRSPYAFDPSSPTPAPPHHVLLQIPKPKSRYHYAIGDLCQMKWASVHYSLIVKVRLLLYNILSHTAFIAQVSDIQRIVNTGSDQVQERRSRDHNSERTPSRTNERP